MVKKIFLFLFCISSVICAENTPAPMVNRSPFGAQMVWPANPHLEKIIERMEEAGIQWAHFDLIWWGICEQEKGKYDFTSPQTDVPAYKGWDVDNAVSLLQESKIEIFATLGYGNDLYDDHQGPHSAEARKAFGDYCYAAAERYKESIYYWEIWNEPNLSKYWPPEPSAEDYTRLVIEAASRIREANPKAKVAAGATSHVDILFLEKCFWHGLLEAVDIITVRPYRFEKPESLNKNLEELCSRMKKYTDKKIEIWSGEWGYNTFIHNINERNHAKTLSRMMVNDLSQDMGLSIWFSTHAFPEHSKGKMNPEWGLLDYSYKPRPAFYAMKTAIERLPAPVTNIPDPFDIQASIPEYTERCEVFKHDESTFTIVFWLERWPLKGSFPGIGTDVSLNKADKYIFQAFDGITGEPVNLNIHRGEDSKVILKNLLFRDYPVYIDLKLEKEPRSPEKALDPNHCNGHSGVSIVSDLQWKNGGGATRYDVYFGEQSPPRFRGSWTENFYDPGEMQLNKKYYWRIDSRNRRGTAKGDVWTFKTESTTPTPTFTPTPTETPSPGEPLFYLDFDDEDVVLKNGDAYYPDPVEERAWGVKGVYAEVINSDDLEISAPAGDGKLSPSAKGPQGGKALIMDSGGKVESFNVETDSSYPLGDYTIEVVFWSAAENLEGNRLGIQNIFASWSVAENFDYLYSCLRILGDGDPVGRPQDSGHLEFVVWDAAGREKRIVSKKPVKTREWNTLQAVFDYNESDPANSEMMLYINGVLQGKRSIKAEGLLHGLGALLTPNYGTRRGVESCRFIIGSSPIRLLLSDRDHRGLQGAIDAFSISNEALDPSGFILPKGFSPEMSTGNDH